MTTLNELVYELLELRRAYIKDTDPLDKRIVIDWIQTCRSRLLKQKFDQPFASIDNNYVQSLGPIELEKISSDEILPIIGDENFMYRTTITIPKTIENKWGSETFTRIGPADRMSIKYKVLPYEKALFFGNGKFNSNAICSFRLGDYLYLTSKSGIHYGVKYVDINGVFQNPILAARIKDSTWDYNDNYPINKEIVDQLKMLIIQTKFGLTLVQAGDKTDNKEDNPEGGRNVSVPKGQSQDTGGL
jgi:hypothetical protein